MATSLALKRFVSSNLLSNYLFRPFVTAPSISRSLNTNAVRSYDDESDDKDIEIDRRSDRYFPRGVFDPFSQPRTLGQVLNLMDQFIESPFMSASRGDGAGVRRNWNAKETDDALLLRVDMPGLGKEDVKVAVEQNTLTIKGEGPKEGEDEQNVGRYTSRIDLPEKLYKLDQIKAEMKNGVLKVTVPKLKEEERADVIHVKVD
ncbi:Heat shock protein [Quillaja saponaria]|uniref:Heat shock protein n=1 Tax=Quillaja saponaria TaxID=32244 RepID=A0AAD7L1I0_QUISA|nr:Heat shock protein [Quillaja saponaria]